MEKSILQEYVDACELIRETEQDIRRLNQKRKEITHDKVRGSMNDFPYIEQNFNIHGSSFSPRDENRLRCEEELLERTRQRAEAVKVQVEEWMLTIPARMQRIVRYRYLEGLSWQQVAARMGYRTTADSVRMEIERFLDKSK